MRRGKLKIYESSPTDLELSEVPPQYEGTR